MTARTTAHSVNGSTMPASASSSPNSPPVPNAASSPMPATAGGSTSGSSTSVTTSARPRKRRVARNHAVGVPKPRIRALAIEVRPRGDLERVAHRRVAEQVRDVAQRHLGEERDERDREEREQDARAERQQRGERAPRGTHSRGGSPKP